jgi:molybdate-binding protein/transcriptional regulator with XRE-family HTH domain
MIMAKLPAFENHLRALRVGRGWSQDEVARRSGLSRAGVSAIETGRLVPSAAAALALAAAFGGRVEDLFRLRRPDHEGASWAWLPRRGPCRYWHAEVGGRTWLYPVEATPLGVVPHDGVAEEDGGSPRSRAGTDPSRNLVVASCDPAVGLLAAELARTADVRLTVLPRPSRTALALLGQGLVHAAGVHLAKADDGAGNAPAVKAALGKGYSLLRVARWEEGVAFSAALRLPTIREAVASPLRWVGRQDGSGARQCLDELLGGRRPPRRLASDHRGVAEAVRSGWADAGVCLRLVSDEAGLDFLSVRHEVYDLCVPDRWKADPRLQALADVVRSKSYRRSLGELPGYDSTETGAFQRVN